MALVSSQDVLILNGDSYLELDVLELLDSHKRHGGSMTIALRHVDDAARYGRVEVDAVGRITRFVEKGAAGGGYINAGVYACRRVVFDSVEGGRALSIETDIFPRLAEAGTLYGFVCDGRFIDIGVPESYLAAVDFFHDKT
jgi:NDP-sugar pyrophosphorylase family protein